MQGRKSTGEENVQVFRAVEGFSCRIFRASKSFMGLLMIVFPGRPGEFSVGGPAESKGPAGPISVPGPYKLIGPSPSPRLKWNSPHLSSQDGIFAARGFDNARAKFEGPCKKPEALSPRIQARWAWLETIRSTPLRSKNPVAAG